MRILHINTGQMGGAAWCAIRLCKSLVQSGVDSRMLFAEGKILPDGIDGAIAYPDKHCWQSIPVLRNVLYRLLPKIPFFTNQRKLQKQLNEANETHLFLHQPFSDYINIGHHPLVEWADIIHLHWVADFVDYPTFFKEVKKPIVWTLHDKYPAVGIQHFCSEFYPIPDKLKYIDDLCTKIKRKSVSKSNQLHLVAISEQMIGICRNSDVLKGFPITCIYNGVDVNIFKRYDKQKARKELGLLLDATIFLYSSFCLNDYNKGLIRTVRALEKIAIPNKILICIGGSSVPMPEASIPIILTGMLSNQSKIAKYYSATDYFLQSSLEETFAQTPIESMACGTPVISTPCSGTADLINKDNGVVCGDYTVEALVDGIKLAMSRKYNRAKIREDIINRFSYDKIAKQYIDLYKSLLISNK